VPVKGNLVFGKMRLALGMGEAEKIDGKILFGVLAFALLIRIPLLIYPEAIHNDAIESIRHARQILQGDWSTGKTHPFYPTLIGLFWRYGLDGVSTAWKREGLLSVPLEFLSVRGKRR
jgi:hypothetical protein